MKYSNSKLNDYRFCPRSYYYKNVCRIEPQEDGQIEHDRSFGAAIHEGLKVLYDTKSVDKACEKFIVSYPEQLDTEDLAKTKENGVELIRLYWMRYGQEMSDWNILSNEILEEYEPIEGVIFRVKLDMVAENKKYGGVYGFDFKTTSKSLSWTYWSQFNPNAQISTYFDFITKKFGSCSGFYIDAMSFGFRQRKYKDQPAGFHAEFDRQLFMQTKDQLEDWRGSERYWVKMIGISNEDDRWPMNTRSCTYCSYRPICAAGWSWDQDKDLILAQYSIRQEKK